MSEDPGTEPIKKLYYSISEVSEMLGVKPHVLRYWETQFGALRPKKSRAGNRMYRERDVEILRQIQDLLHVRRYTIAGARRELSRLRASGASAAATGSGDDAILLEASDPDVSGRDAESEEDLIETSAPDDSAVEQYPSRDEPPAEEQLPTQEEPVAEERTSVDSESASSVDLPPTRTPSAGHGRSAKDPLQTSLDVPRPAVPRAALTELREEIVRLQEWLEHGAKH